MNLDAFLADQADAILRDATATIELTRLPHYRQAGPAETGERLARLFVEVRTALATRRLDALDRYVGGIAVERHRDGAALLEVQTAINVLEERIWRALTGAVGGPELGTAIGLVSTVFGEAKDSLARRWVALVSRRDPEALDLGALFRGTEDLEPEVVG